MCEAYLKYHLTLLVVTNPDMLWLWTLLLIPKEAQTIINSHINNKVVYGVVIIGVT